MCMWSMFSGHYFNCVSIVFTEPSEAGEGDGVGAIRETSDHSGSSHNFTDTEGASGPEGGGVPRRRTASDHPALWTLAQVDTP